MTQAHSIASLSYNAGFDVQVQLNVDTDGADHVHSSEAEMAVRIMKGSGDPRRAYPKAKDAGAPSKKTFLRDRSV